MLDLARKYENELKKMFNETYLDFKYLFYYDSNYRDEFKLSDSSWNVHQFVSIDKNKNILGYLKYGIDRVSNRVYGMQIVNFTNNKIIFGKDFKEFIKDIFIKFKFRKLSFVVYIGNPIEKTYDKLINKYGGKIIGIKHNHDLLLDGNIYDLKEYELERDNFLKNYKISKKSYKGE